MTMTISIGRITVDMTALINSRVTSVENDWAFFPSASVAWRISKENFMSDLTFLDDMKIRASIGLLGTMVSFISPYAFLSTYGDG